MTNRFDWEILNPAPYYRNLRAILMNPGLSNRVVWVANNPFEAFYLEEKLGIPSLSERVSVIHPLGLSGVDFTYPDSLPPPSKSHFAIRAFYCGRIHSLLAKKIPLTIIPVASHYGGPQALVKFKGYIDFPYQYSTMKLYENLASNVDVFIPTPRLLEELIKKDTHCSSWISIPTVKDLSKKHLLTPAPTFPPWSALFDFYNPLFAPYIHYFDTLEELSVISSVEKKGGKEFYADYRREILQKWRRVLEQVHRRTSS
ncbi:hypothetical protein BCR33DRAFT_719630 [Rhizoclosmatium globosum]|uniref:Glycosyltransferase family 1 protein n=1 Tax=Rhizoclosmatium globosum TaxID=329046 RepID=A0A1Y2BZX4_9FUNG|nr:hypothetical protein BCR33DRAFT_719630 [Rhizoclosmatium globosum]|eukprot:ORY40276.1 hypothetical protein BCR33DRAFT_719630 [Rhizoclosmatium globosum]